MVSSLPLKGLPCLSKVAYQLVLMAISRSLSPTFWRKVLAGLLDATYGNVPLAQPLAPNGYLIMSGIIEDKAGLVIDAARRQGLALADQKQENDWVALVMQHRP